METTDSGTILIIDDEKIVRQALRRMLEPLGYTILEVGKGVDGLQAFNHGKDQIDLVLLDLALSDVADQKMLAALQTMKPEVKILICTGRSTDHLGDGKAYRGVKGIIRKPFPPRKLVEKVRSVLQG